MSIHEVRITIGPIDVRVRRRPGNASYGLLGSLSIHLLILLLAIVASDVWRSPAPPPEKPPIQVALEEPRTATEPPAVLRQPAAPRRSAPPPAQESRPLRMTPSTREPERSERAQATPGASTRTRDADGRPAGGSAGGPLRVPTPGFRSDRSMGSDAPQAEAPATIDSRLRDFKRALDSVPTTPGGKLGGGSGPGGGEIPALPPSGFGVGNLEFESRDYDWGDYGRAIYVAIWRAWHNRLYLTSESFEKWAFKFGTTELDHQSRVRFTINADGDVTDVALETPSGCVPLDESAVDALRAVVLPPLPSDFPRGQETVHARFIAEGDIRGMRSHLHALKAAGFF